MPVAPTYPGVYIEEVPSGVRTIVGVSTSVAAFIGFLPQGPMNEAVQLFSFADFERAFGGLSAESEVSYAVQQFFLNGGSEAYVVRTASGGAARASVTLGDGSGSGVLEVEAVNEGVWGNYLQVGVDYNTSDPTTLFNLTVVSFGDDDSTVRQAEAFLNLSMTDGHPRNAETVVNDDNTGSQLVRVDVLSTQRPAQNGTVSGDLSTFPALTEAQPSVGVTIGSVGPQTAMLASVPASLSAARGVLEAAIRASKPDDPAFSEATVEVVQGSLRVLAGPTSASSQVTFSGAGTDPTLTELGLDPAAVTAVQGLVSGLDLDPFPTLTSGTPAVDVLIDGTRRKLDLSGITSLATTRTTLEGAIRTAEPGSPAFAQARVATYAHNSESKLVVIPGTAGVSVSFEAPDDASDATTVGELGLDGGSVTSVEGVVSGDLTAFPALSSAAPAVGVTIGFEGPHIAALGSVPGTLATARTALEAAIRGAFADPAFTSTRVAAYDHGGDARLITVAGSGGSTVAFSAAPTDTATVAELRLDAANGASVNVQAYRLGAGAIAGTAQGAGTAGNDGTPPDGTALIGSESEKTGLYALADVDFNLLAIPRTATLTGTNALSSTDAFSVLSRAVRYCEQRRAFFLMDTPDNVATLAGVKEWVQDNDTLRSRNAAFYFPRVRIPDPLDGFRLRSVGASGTVAGLYARTDSERGVWKAPAGTDATLRGVQALGYKLTDAENGAINPLGINAIRQFPIFGNVAWGARTLRGADQLADEYKYIPVRRLALFLEESLYRGTKWAVFEPNDEPLWAQLRLNIGAFMQNLFRQGAFAGRTPREAYLVRCDRTTTTQNDINLGIVNILVGFAPLKPAEFVIIKIQQLAGQLDV